MLMKKGFIYIWFVMSCIPFIITNNHVDSGEIGDFLSSESKKIINKAETSNDIERLLLRPIKLEKEDVNTSNLKSVYPLFNPETEQSIDGITSILSSERKKLYELEDKYKKLEKELIKRDDKNNADLGRIKDTKLISASFGDDRLKGGRKSVEGPASTQLEKMNSVKNVVSRAGSSTTQQRTTKNRREQEIDSKEDISHLLSKLTGNGRLLDLAECFYKLCEYNNALQTYKLITPTDTPLNQYIWAQYQIANCYRNMKEFDLALGEYQRFINQYPSGDLIEPAKWYIDDVIWWKSWYEKNSLVNSGMPELSNGVKSE
ncbi:MAG: hypothetical protein CV087_14795 [Candidatus Brocadia sp. WS118]|nr:MAG: hypothetical protein CV087_14795 [Candidatus Brocadia sp. WS118]